MKICLRPFYKIYHFFFPKLNKIEEPGQEHSRASVDLLEPNLYSGKEIDFGKFLGRIDFATKVGTISLSKASMSVEVLEIYDSQFKILSEGTIYPVEHHSSNDVYILWEIKDNVLLCWEKGIGFTAEIDA